jgi:hypothetical protein
MKIAVILSLFFFTASTLRAQINKIEVTDYYCLLIDSIIMFDADIHTSFMVHSINFETNKRAIGKQFTNIMFYYPMPMDSVVESDKGTEFLYIYKPPVKVEVKYNIAASQDISIDYYFDEKGKLVFYHTISTGAYDCSGEKYYFAKGKLLKRISYSINNWRESNQEIVENSVKDRDFTKNDLFLAGKIIKKSKKYIKMFNRLVELEGVDKE